MRILRDTHVLIWSLHQVERLPSDLCKALSKRENDDYFSAASIWEIAIKCRTRPQLGCGAGVFFYKTLIATVIARLRGANKAPAKLSQAAAKRQELRCRSETGAALISIRSSRSAARSGPCRPLANRFHWI